MTMSDDAPMLTVRQFAEAHGVTKRSVERWLEEGRLHGVQRLDSGNLIPYQPRPTSSRPSAAPAAGQALAVPTLTQLAPVPGSLLDALAQKPAFLTLEEAAQFLGIPQTAIRRGVERFGLERVGERGAYMVPQRIVRDVAGL